VDPAVVNLNDVETYFQEKRPFFVEGSSNFSCGNQGADNYWGFNWPEPTFFYSRRVGRAPQVDASGDYVNAPIGTSILGAAKLVGKMTPTLNFGTLRGDGEGGRGRQRRRGPVAPGDRAIMLRRGAGPAEFNSAARVSA
jgi:hypothetical protein